MVFIAALLEATTREESQTSSCRCPLLSILHKDIIAPTSFSVRIVAALQVVLAKAWFDDQVIDGNGLFRPARGLARRKVDSALAELSAVGFEMRTAKHLATRQVELESQTNDVRTLAGPTSAVLAEVMGAIPDMPLAMSMNEPQRMALHTLGESLGVAIYAVDALKDLEGDVGNGSFNPCVDADGWGCTTQLQQSIDVLRESLVTIEGALENLIFARGEERGCGRRFAKACPCRDSQR